MSFLCTCEFHFYFCVCLLSVCHLPNLPIYSNSILNFYYTFGKLFLLTIVDAVFAMAHALHKNIKDVCGDIEFRQCDQLHPSPLGAELLRAIRDVSFVGMQGTQVNGYSRKKI